MKERLQETHQFPAMLIKDHSLHQFPSPLSTHGPKPFPAHCPQPSEGGAVVALLPREVPA